MTNFEAWLQQADMPEQRGDEWVDLETGLPYDPKFDYIGRKPRQTISPKALEARNVAKFFGGKALEGSKAQKDWAERIRAQKLAEMKQDQAELACDPNGLLNHSKFWIENQSKSGSSIGEFVVSQKGLLAQARALQAAGKAEEYAAVAAKYNELTGKWGF